MRRDEKLGLLALGGMFVLATLIWGWTGFKAAAVAGMVAVAASYCSLGPRTGQREWPFLAAFYLLQAAGVALVLFFVNARETPLGSMVLSLAVVLLGTSECAWCLWAWYGWKHGRELGG